MTNSSNITLTLTSYNLGADSTPDDYDSWVSYVRRHVEAESTFTIERIEQARCGEPGDDTVSGATDEEKWIVLAAVTELWGTWCGLGTTLADLQRRCQGGIVRNDRGNGSAGPVYLGEGWDDNNVLDQRITIVSEAEDADAWRLARETFVALGLAGEPEFVAVGVRADNGEFADESGAQAVYCA